MLRSFCLCEELLSSPTFTRQLQELLKAAGRLQRLCPQAFTAVQQKQQAVTQAWEALQLRMEQRKALLEQAYLLVRFHTAVRAFFPWEGYMCVQMCACTEAFQFWMESVRRGKGKVHGPGRAGLDDGRETE